MANVEINISMGVFHHALRDNAMRGFQFGQSEEPEVVCIWPEVGGKPLHILLLFWQIHVF